jgi:periplasmic protein TonB
LQEVLRWETAPRTGPLLVVLALHAAALVAFIATSALRERIIVPATMEVAFVEAPPTSRTPPPPLDFRPRLAPPMPVSIAAPDIPMMTRVEPIAPPAPAPNPAPTITAPVAAAVPVTAAPPLAPPTIEPPRFDLAYLRNPPPAYPAGARRVREQGRVILRVLVTPEGAPDSVEVRTSSGSERLDRAAIDAVKRWRFSPARRGTEAVSAYALVPVLFALDS